jgi:hypothetical protein
MSAENTHEKFPSGKVIGRYGGRDLTVEQHVYGALDIGIKYEFKDGAKISETYFYKGRLVSRRTYEKARAKYEDMPAADPKMEDWGGGLLQDMSRERRLRSAEAKRHLPDSEKAKEIDAFCHQIMDEGKCEDAVAWIKNRKHNLGEMNWAKSQQIVKRLAALGCVHIYACQVDSYGDAGENTGHLVVELPSTGEPRKKILRMIDQLAEDTGYNAPFDEGQQFAYVNLD